MFYLLEHMAACAPFLPGGEGRSDTFPSRFSLSQMHYLSLVWRAVWEAGTPASCLSWVSGRMSRARDEQHEVWSGDVNFAGCAVFCGEVFLVKGVWGRGALEGEERGRE